jgi:DNA-binding NarL/FixJ family response regulator
VLAPRGTGVPTPIELWVVGDHALFNQAFEALSVQLPGVRIAGQANSLELLSPQSLETGTGLILWVLPVIENLESLSILQMQHLSGKVLLLCMDWTSEHLKESLKAGAAGCLSVDMSATDLAEALRQAARGEVYLSSKLARDLILNSVVDIEAERGPSYDSLTAREKELLPLLRQGLSNKQIAQSLYLSVRTVENHLASIYEKLGVSSRTEAAILAIQKSWI